MLGRRLTGRTRAHGFILMSTTVLVCARGLKLKHGAVPVGRLPSRFNRGSRQFARATAPRVTTPQASEGVLGLVGRFNTIIQLDLQRGKPGHGGRAH